MREIGKMGRTGRLVPKRGEVKARICVELIKEVKSVTRSTSIVKKPKSSCCSCFFGS